MSSTEPNQNKLSISLDDGEKILLDYFKNMMENNEPSSNKLTGANLFLSYKESLKPRVKDSLNAEERLMKFENAIEENNKLRAIMRKNK